MFAADFSGIILDIVEDITTANAILAVHGGGLDRVFDNGSKENLIDNEENGNIRLHANHSLLPSSVICQCHISIIVFYYSHIKSPLFPEKQNSLL